MKCPVCGAAELIHDTRDLPYRGHLGSVINNYVINATSEVGY